MFFTAIENNEVFVCMQAMIIIMFILKVKLSVFPFSSTRKVQNRAIRDPWWTLAYFCASFLELQSHAWMDI